MTANVRAITIRQPYAWAIVKKGKRIERTLSTKSRGDLFIHAGLGMAMSNGAKRGSASVPADLPRGTFVAMCRLADVVPKSDDRWFEGE